MRVLIWLPICLACNVEASAKFGVLNRVRGVAKSSAQAALLDKLASLIETGEAFTVKQQPQIDCDDCKGDDFCAAICLFISKLPDIEQFITDAETATITKIADHSSDLKTESDQASSVLTTMKSDDESWAMCTREAFGLAKTADTKHTAYVNAQSTRESACQEPSPYLTWDDYRQTIEIPVFECDLAQGTTCEDDMLSWKTSLTGAFSAVTSHLSNCIQKHQDVLDAHNERDTAYNNHGDKRDLCEGRKSTRDHSCGITFPGQMDAYCDAKTAFDAVISDVNGTNNIDSEKDRIQECQGVRALDCVMREIIFALTNETDFELNTTVLQICQSREPYTDCVQDYTLSADELKQEEYSNSTSAIACESQTVSGLAYAYVYDSVGCATHPYVNGQGCYTNTTNRDIDVTKDTNADFSTDCTP